jgi:hypothetical protein
MVHYWEGRAERNMPKSKFSKGIMDGKLMAKEFDVLLLIAVILRITEGTASSKVSKIG